MEKRNLKITSADSHLLLIDEPEISLHPKAIREACNVLYSLPENDLWQVMITTHSPNFIDLSKDHTTIVRVEKQNSEKIETTTLYCTDDINFTSDEKDNLKLLNLIDPHVLEFFFGGRVLLVEGDTEYNAFNYIKDFESKNGNTSFDDLLVIRARGKVQVSSLMKVLNHFKKDYFVLHDTDSKKTTRKQTVQGDNEKKYIELKEIINPAWTNNDKILNNMSVYSNVYASLINFEVANFDEFLSSGKPSNVIDKLKIKENYDSLRELLDGILNGNLNHERFRKWTTIEELCDFVDTYDNLEIK